MKHVDLKARSQGTRPELSLTARVAGLVSLVGVCVLLISTLLPYVYLSSTLRREQQGWLTDRIEEFATLLRDEPDRPELLEAEIRRETEAGRPRRFYARLLDAYGKPLVTTSGMAGSLPTDWFPTSARSGRRPAATPKRGRDGRSYLAVTSAVRVGPKSGDRRLLQVALDVTQDEALLARYRKTAAVVFVLGLLVCVGGGVYVGRTGLRPLEKITELAERIGPERLDERLGHVRWPAELSSLAIVFDQMLERIQDSFRKLSQFSADIAHELRTPLSNLRTETEVALTQPRSPEHYRQVLESSLEEFEHLSQVIDGLLFLARAEGDAPLLGCEVLNVRTEIDAVMQFFRPLAQERNIRLVCEGGGFLNADRTLLRRALANLVSNAIRYTPPTGTVTIAAAERNGNVEIRVTDTGCGIAPEHVPRVFDRFYRVESSRQRATGGSGLGLSLVRSIMTLHGGTASLRSREGQGTTVILSFPRFAVRSSLTPL